MLSKPLASFLQWNLDLSHPISLESIKVDFTKTFQTRGDFFRTNFRFFIVLTCPLSCKICFIWKVQRHCSISLQLIPLNNQELFQPISTHRLSAHLLHISSSSLQLPPEQSAKAVPFQGDSPSVCHSSCHLFLFWRSQLHSSG